MQVHTPRPIDNHNQRCPIDDYSELYLALLIPGSRLNARNSPDARPYCNHQPLKKILRIERNRKNLTTRKFFTQIIFNVKISRSTVYDMYLILGAQSDPVGIEQFT